MPKRSRQYLTVCFWGREGGGARTLTTTGKCRILFALKRGGNNNVASVVVFMNSHQIWFTEDGNFISHLYPSLYCLGPRRRVHPSCPYCWTLSGLFFFNPGEGFIRTRPCPNTRPRRRVYPSCPSTGPRRRVYLSLPYYRTQEKGLPALPYLFWT